MAATTATTATTANEHPLTVVYRDSGACLGYWRNVALLVWTDRLTLPRIEGAHRVMDALLERDGNGFVSLTLIPQLRVSNLSMDDDVRRRHDDLYTKTAGRTLANAIAVETPGFVAAFVRAIISGSLLLTRSTVPTRVFEARAHAAAWLVEQARHEVPALSAASVLEKIRALSLDIDAR
jgi:hypothetical protein